MKIAIAFSCLCLFALVALFGIPGVGILHPKVARAQTGCELSTLAVPYSYNINGTYYDNQGYYYLYGEIGLMMFDGNGNITGSASLSDDGTAAHITYTGTYTMNPDCSGNMTINFTNGSEAFDFVLKNGGKGINLIETDPGVVITGTATPTNAPATETPAQ